MKTKSHIKKVVLTVISLMISIGCQRKANYGDTPDEAVFRPYVESFDAAYGGTMPEILFFFAELENSAAECVKLDTGERIINVNSISWEWYSRAQKRSLIWHELGHCVLNRDHTAADSISHMSPSVQQTDFIEQNQDEMDAEMFDGPIQTNSHHNHQHDDHGYF
jgi:hypothetical protein